jgi:protoporphyrin/coproporphyrin ferrochelatase
MFSAHSIPSSMSASSDYVVQLREASGLVADAVATRLGRSIAWDLVFQSRSGPPGQPWLEPDVCDHLSALAGSGTTAAVIVPIGFISDHMEVLYDLDTQAAQRAAALGIALRRAPTPATDPRFVSMVRELIEERIAVSRGDRPNRRACGAFGARPDVCAVDCCPAASRPSTGRPAGEPGAIPTSRGPAV